MPPFGNTRSAGDRARRPNLIHCISLRERERESGGTAQRPTPGSLKPGAARPARRSLPAPLLPPVSPGRRRTRVARGRRAPARPNKGPRRPPGAAAATRSPGLRPRRRLRGAPAARAWRWRGRSRPPGALGGAPAVGARSVPTPRDRDPARAAGGRRHVPAGPGPVPATPRCAPLLGLGRSPGRRRQRRRAAERGAAPLPPPRAPARAGPRRRRRERDGAGTACHGDGRGGPAALRAAWRRGRRRRLRLRGPSR